MGLGTKKAVGRERAGECNRAWERAAAMSTVVEWDAILVILPFLPESRARDTWMCPFGGDQAPTVVYLPVQRTGPGAAAVTVTSQP
jgi:hypothetical protein